MSSNKPVIINLDEDPHNRDWLRRVWPFDAMNKADLLAELDEQGMTLDELKETPMFTYQKTQPGMEWLNDL